jgi:hypothetical protein
LLSYAKQVCAQHWLNGLDHFLISRIGIPTISMQDIYAHSYFNHQLRCFFQDKKSFIEVFLSILTAYKETKTISPFIFDNINYPLTQTGWISRHPLRCS